MGNHNFLYVTRNKEQFIVPTEYWPGKFKSGIAVPAKEALDILRDEIKRNLNNNAPS